MTRFPDSRIAATSRSSSQAVAGSVTGLASEHRTKNQSRVSLAAYSGGTVWASHPLRVAAGVSVKCTASIAGLPRSSFLRNILSMSKSSTATVRERPVEHVVSANAGGLTIHGETIVDRKSTRLNSSHIQKSRMPSSA